MFFHVHVLCLIMFHLFLLHRFLSIVLEAFFKTMYIFFFSDPVHLNISPETSRQPLAHVYSHPYSQPHSHPPFHTPSHPQPHSHSYNNPNNELNGHPQLQSTSNPHSDLNPYPPSPSPLHRRPNSPPRTQPKKTSRKFLSAGDWEDIQNLVRTDAYLSREEWDSLIYNKFDTPESSENAL